VATTAHLRACGHKGARATVLALALAALAASCGGSGGASNGVPKGHGVNKEVSFTDRYGKVAITVASAGTSDAIFKGFDGQPDKSKNGVFVFVTFDKFAVNLVGPADMTELKGSDGLLYESTLSDGPDSGQATFDPKSVDPNHFTEAFDLPKNAAKGAVLIVHENGTERDAFEIGGRTPPPGYEEGAHTVDLGL
jgi:hypothetical protein